MIKHEGKLVSNGVRNGKLGTLVDSGKMKVKPYEDNGTRYPTQVLKFKRDTLKSNLHPTQKPIALFEWLIKTYSDEGDLILDNCMGSGTTAIACMNTNRDFIGCELDETYYNIASRRISENNNLESF
jgi:DNA modification methylase